MSQRWIKLRLKRRNQIQPDQALAFDTVTGVVLEERDKKTLAHFPGIVTEDPFYVEGGIEELVVNWSAKAPANRKL